MEKTREELLKLCEFVSREMAPVPDGEPHMLFDACYDVARALKPFLQPSPGMGEIAEIEIRASLFEAYKDRTIDHMVCNAIAEDRATLLRFIRALLSEKSAPVAATPELSHEAHQLAKLMRREGQYKFITQKGMNVLLDELERLTTAPQPPAQPAVHEVGCGYWVDEACTCDPVGFITRAAAPAQESGK